MYFVGCGCQVEKNQVLSNTVLCQFQLQTPKLNFWGASCCSMGVNLQNAQNLLGHKLMTNMSHFGPLMQ